MPSARPRNGLPAAEARRLERAKGPGAVVSGRASPSSSAAIDARRRCADLHGDDRGETADPRRLAVPAGNRASAGGARTTADVVLGETHIRATHQPPRWTRSPPSPTVMDLGEVTSLAQDGSTTTPAEAGLEQADVDVEQVFGPAPRVRAKGSLRLQLDGARTVERVKVQG